jgi:hypothetical protein
MSSRSERYLANAEKCRQCSEAAYTTGTKHLYAELASQWLRLAEQADRKDEGAAVVGNYCHADSN